MPGGSTTEQTSSQNTSESGTQSGFATGTQSQNQNAQTGPWSASEPLLRNIMGQLGGFSTGVTPGQSEALAGMESAAGALPNFGDDATGVVRNFMGSQPKYDGMLTGALGDYEGGLSPYLSDSFLDPMSTPGFSDALKGIQGNITNQINSQFAAAGRDLSPGNTTALAEGLMSGSAPMLLEQYNRNMGTQRGAQDALLSARGGYAGMLSDMDQTALGNQAQGVSMAGSVPGLYMNPSAAQFDVANTGYGLPYQNLGMLQGLALPVAGMGTSSTGSSMGSTSGTTGGNFSSTGTQTGKQTNTKNTDPWANIIGGVVGGVGLASKMGMFSDENLKENKYQVGMLYDGSPVWSYNYIGDETPRIGLMAQEVEQSTPEAVGEVMGFKTVDYGVATERARAIGGMLDDLDMAA